MTTGDSGAGEEQPAAALVGTTTFPVCDDRCVSRLDLAHVLNALSRLSRGDPDAGVPVAEIDEAIGRGHGDMRTPLNLQSLADERLAVRLPEGTWALTAQGIAWLKQDRELSDR
jgi:hypothetical protein